MLKLIYGAAKSGKTARITQEIAELVRGGSGRAILIVPEQYSHECERELCALCGDSLSLHAEVLSFSRLAVRVAQEAGTSGKTALDKGGRLLCTALALRAVAPRLRVYRAAVRKAELLSGIEAAISELKAAGVTADTLTDAAEKTAGELSGKLADLALCMEAYNSVLAQGRADPTDRLARLAETVSQSSFASCKIYIDGFIDFTGAEERIIEALLRAGTDVTVCLTLDEPFGNAENFAPSRTAAARLRSAASALGCEYSDEKITSEESETPLTFYGEHLFSYTSEKMEAADAVTLCRCDSTRCECELAAAKCLELVRAGARYRDIAVAVRGFDELSSTLEDVFRLYGVPLFTARRTSLLQKPAPALISAAFDVILGGWDLSDVRTYYKTGLLPLSQDALDALDCYCLRWALLPGAWTQKSAWSQHPDGYGGELDEESAARLLAIDETRKLVAKPLLSLQKHGDTAKTAAEQAQALSDFLTEIDLPSTLSKKADALSEIGRGQLAAEYAQVWDVTVAALEQFVSLLGDTPMSQQEFAELFAKLLERYDVSAIPVFADSVSAGDFDRMRRRHLKHLIILGATDEALPAPLPSGGLLSPDERDALAALGVNIGGGREDFSRELSLIYNTVSLPSDTLTLSYCCFDANGNEARPGMVITRARQLFDLSILPFDARSARLSAPAPLFFEAADRSGGSAHALAEAYVMESESAQRLAEIRSRAAVCRGSLSPESVRALYGETLRISPSRADSYVSCRFAYFLRYGLRLNERETSAFDAPELGSFVHFVLECAAREIQETVGFKAASDELVCALADKYTDEYVKTRLHGFADKSRRFVYLFDRLRPTVRAVALDTVRELSKGDFQPLDFELLFGGGGKLPAVRFSDGDRELFINGIADRVDGCFKDGKLYLRVVDYKTGKKSFSLSDVWYGLGLQMLLYLFALESEGAELYGEKIVPAGVMYVPARDKPISADGDMSDKDLSKARAAEKRRSGLILDDAAIIEAMERGEKEYLPVSYDKKGELKRDTVASAEQLEILRRHVENRMLELSEDLSAGSIEARPCYKNETDNACIYCAYRRVCRFDESRDRRKYLTKIKPEEFWVRAEEETK